MKKEEILKQLSITNDQVVQFQEDSDLSKIGATVCALLNTKGGYLVTIATGKHTDCKKLEPLLLTIERSILQQISPKAVVHFDCQVIEKRGVFLIEVPAGKDIPYSYKNDIFLLSAKKIHKADINTIRDMVLRRQNEPERWERRFSDAPRKRPGRYYPEQNA